MSNRKLKLHQVLAIESNVRSQTQKDLTEIHHNLQKNELLFGFEKTYEPRKADTETLATESKVLQVRTPEALKNAADLLNKMYDIVATRDFANCTAKADVVLDDGTVLLKDAPATYLLWLEKKLEDLHTLVSKLPVLPADTEWESDEKQNCFKSPVIETMRTQKEFYPLVLHPGTDKHPPNVVEKSKDVTVGVYKTIKYSGAMKLRDIVQMKERVAEIQKAVKFAREQANTVDAPMQEVGKPILDHVFGKLLTV